MFGKTKKLVFARGKSAVSKDEFSFTEIVVPPWFDAGNLLRKFPASLLQL